MANPLQMLFGRNSLRNRIERQAACLYSDIERWQTQTHLLRDSAISTATSPLALASTVAVGFFAGRKLQKPKREKQQPETPASPASPLWWELMLPAGIALARYFITAKLLAGRDKAP